MSVENAKSFHIRINKDSAFRTLLERASSKEKTYRLMEDAGYDFTVDEWQQAMKAFQANDNNELKEEELEAVAGGSKVSDILDGSSGNPLYDRIREIIADANSRPNNSWGLR